MLTERQMLEAMLTQSANDIAYSLAVWDAGSIPAFVAKMNATAALVGATSSHYVDESGYDPGSVSTASDCLRVAAAAMTIPTFAEVVAMTSVTLPLVGTVPNIVTEIGSNGVVGIKSGYTSQAKGCMVLAAVADGGGPARAGAGRRAHPAGTATGGAYHHDDQAHHDHHQAEGDHHTHHARLPLPRRPPRRPCR